METIRINKKYQPLYTSDDPLIIVTGGRGSGKSFAISDFVCRLTYERGQKILYNRYTLSAAEISIIPEYNEKIELLNAQLDFYSANNEILNKRTGSAIIFKGIKTSSGNQTANLKSIKDPTTWIMDEAEEMPDYETYQKIKRSFRKKGIKMRTVMVLNPPHKKHWIYQTFFKANNIPDYFNGSVNDITYIHTDYLDNIENLNEEFIRDAEQTKENNPIEYDHVFRGKWIDDVFDALWKDDIIQEVSDIPEFVRCAVAIDPSGRGTKDSDECGIITGGIAADGKIYITNDDTGIMTPLQWANKAIYRYENNDLDCMVAEVNQGWDMVHTIIHQIEPRIKVVEVVSSKGKKLRADPVVALYEQRIVIHKTGLKRLRSEMTTWVPGDKESPGRIDALVHLVNYLYKPKKDTKNIWA
jgi:hypothetical protein